MFYVSFVPLWEGFDEWSHYAVLQKVATGGRALASPNEPFSREVQASLDLAPAPWLATGLKHDAYWRLPGEERKDRERKLRLLPAEWAREPAEHGDRVYEAQQAPLYYWLMAPAYGVARKLPLPERLWLLRLLSLLAASIVIPISFLVARRVFGDSRRALGVAALIAAFPQLMMTVCHIGNDSLAVGLGGIVLLALLLWKEQPGSMPRAVGLGTALGLALLTKAYFLVLVPPLLVLAAIQVRRERVHREALAIVGIAAVLSGWWYGRNIVLTHTLSGEQIDAAVQRLDGLNMLRSVRTMNWLRAADFTFLSHIWLGNWSFLVLRSWMYHFFAIVAALAALGLIVRLLRRPSTDLWLLSGIYVSFLIALGYHALRTFQIEGFPGALGHYLFAIVIVEVILAVTGLEALAPAWSRAIAPAGIVCFAALEGFGMSFYSIPYYTGFIAHLPNGGLPALQLGQLQNGGLMLMITRLTVNKPAFLCPELMAALWALFLAATMGLVATSVRFGWPRSQSQA